LKNSIAGMRNEIHVKATNLVLPPFQVIRLLYQKRNNVNVLTAGTVISDHVQISS
jgi:hypothetical protein